MCEHVLTCLPAYLFMCVYVLCCRSTWQRWIGAVSERRHMFVMDTTALHHWAHTLQKRVGKCLLIMQKSLVS